MATAARSNAGSGGKILRPRRVARVGTPYDRPPDRDPRPENPNWISKHILSPTRVIASGAGKLLSSVFGPESSSSSSSSSGSESDYDNETEDANDGMDESSPVLDEMDQERAKSGTARTLTNEARQAAVTNENKLLIEQLLLQETFSWNECERLTNIIKSRVLETPLSLDRKVDIPSEMCGRTDDRDVEMPDLWNTALTEAKKWLKKNKSVSSRELDLDPPASPHVNEDEMGSPVNVAKSYMKDRPPWTSPCLNSEAQRSASPIGRRLLKYDEPFSINRDSLSSSKVQLKDTPIAGLWNISEEIRLVRSKATEQILRTPSSKIDASASKSRSSAARFDWSGSVSKNKYGVNSPATNILKVGLREKNRISTNLIDASSGPPTSTENCLENEVQGREALNRKHDFVPEERDIRPYDEELNPSTSSLLTSRNMEETCVLLKESPLEIANKHENNETGNGSQTSSSMQYEETSEDITQQTTKQAAVSKLGRKVTRYGRKVRGQGK